jgi:hypothetical protein
MHSDVGGGYEDEKRMSNVALRWMASRLPRTLGVSRSSFPKEDADPLGPMHDSRSGAASAYTRRVRRPKPGDALHQSVLDRIGGELVAPNKKREPKKKYRPRALVQQRDTNEATAFRPNWTAPPNFGLARRFKIVD